MGRIFGTDGARGVANTELTPELAMNIGRAAAMVLTDADGKKPRVLIGKDTRMSCDMLEGALIAGLCAVGADVSLSGALPTPAVAYLVTSLGFDAGIMISASHNPCEYNGIKIFQGDGYKLPDALEAEIEAIILDGKTVPPVKVGGDIGRVTYMQDALDAYVKHVASAAECDLSGMRVAFDCANGSASTTAEKLFRSLGIDYILTSDKPDGVNINAGCGSTHMESLQKLVVEQNCDLGIAFDGDADRMLAVDETGKIVDGDQIIAICAKSMLKKGQLANDTAVVTVMSNMGFFKFCEAHGIRCEVTSVGDRYVLENMRENRHSLGGEQSGHIILSEFATTGDGQLSAVKLLSVLKESGKKLSELAGEMEIYPQVLINVTVTPEGKAAYPQDEVIKQAVAKAEKELNGTGRVLIRLSGTEPLLRVMLEGKDAAQIQRLGEGIAELVKERLGA